MELGTLLAGALISCLAASAVPCPSEPSPRGFDESRCAVDPQRNCGATVYDPLGRKVRPVRNGDGDFFHPEDVQAEDTELFGFAPGDGVLGSLPRSGEISLLRVEQLPDARTRRGCAAVWSFVYEPILNLLRPTTDPRGHDPAYRPPSTTSTSCSTTPSATPTATAWTTG